MAKIVKYNGKKVFSISELKTFLTCPEKYKKKYVDKEKESTVGNALILGIAVHDTLEIHIKENGNVDPLDYFRMRYDTAKKETEDKGQIVTYDFKASYEEDLLRGQEIIEKFLKKHSGPIQRRTVFTEVPFITEIPNCPWALFGKIDVLSEDLKIFDHKTSKPKVTPEFMANDLQFIGYGYGLKYGKPIVSYVDHTEVEGISHLFGKMPSELVYVALNAVLPQWRYDKPYGRNKDYHEDQVYHRYKPTEDDFDRFAKKINNIVNTIRAYKKHDLWYKNLGDLFSSPCNNCGYKDACWGQYYD